MRSRGHEKVRLRSPPRSRESRDYRADRLSDPHDLDGRPGSFSLTPRRERSRREESDGRRWSGEEPSHPLLERRHSSAHFNDDREPLERNRSHPIDGQGRLLMCVDHRSASFEKREYARRFMHNDEEAELKGKYLPWHLTDLNSETNSFKQICSGVTAPRANRERELQDNGPSNLGRIDSPQKSMHIQDGNGRTFLFPQELTYSKGPSQTMLSSEKYSETIPSSASMNAEDYTRYRDSVYQSSLPRQPYEEQGKKTYLKDVSYTMLPFSASQDFGSSSSNRANNDVLNYCHDGQRGIRHSKFKDIDSYTYGQSFDSSRADHVLGFRPSRRDALSPTRSALSPTGNALSPMRNAPSPMRNASLNYSYTELSQRGKNGFGVSTDELYTTRKSVPEEDYTSREPIGRRLLVPVGDRFGGSSSSLSNPRESSLRDYPSVTKYHPLEGISSASGSHGEYRSAGSTHFKYGTKVSEDRDIANYENDYGYVKDARLADIYRECPMDSVLENDASVYRALPSPKQASSEERVLYPSERMTEINYVIGDVDSHIPVSRPKSRNIFERIKPRDDQWTTDVPDRLFSSSKPAFEHFHKRMPSRAFSDSYGAPVDLPLYERENWRGHDFWAVKPKRKLRPSQLALQKKFSVDKKKEFRPSKLQKRAMEDRHLSEIPDNDQPSPRTNSFEKVDPPEGSEEFKQLVHKAFFRFTKQLNDSLLQQKKYQEQGKASNLRCIVCGSLSRAFNDTHGLVTHAFNSLKGLRTEHFGLHKALCVMLGWDSSIAPDLSKQYQSMPAAEAALQREDLILWPPVVVIHTSSIQEILANERMEEMLGGMGFSGGKIKVCSGRQANERLLLVKYPATFSGLQEAEQLHKYFVKNKRGREEWRQTSSKGSSNGGNIGEGSEQVKVEMLLYGYLGTAEDVWKLDDEMKKRCVIRSKKEISAIADASLKD
ncbi:hypothetical protein H6P81_015195 [Aristolochia fimbriata]|uniref:XS domain-containing protein n=1 Tax=Aristolochia fimbriata TaxID=158543 RepID=A0AAV7E4L2_ARIFI|nr:hypothetical protein H6P81_015195 [Aristolochia fimbriata]